MFRYGILLLHFVILFQSTIIRSQAQNDSLKGIAAYLENDTLILKNKRIRFTYDWNRGNIVLLGAKNLETDKELNFSKSRLPSLFLSGEGNEYSQTKIKIANVHNVPNSPIHKQVNIYFTIDELQVRHQIKIFPGATALSHTYFFKGKARSESWLPAARFDRLEMIEKLHKNETPRPSHMAFLSWPQSHWKVWSVSFREATDYNDNLVFEKAIVPYRKASVYSGNVLLASHAQSNIGLFFIKEAPIGFSQQSYPGFDFRIDNESITVHGLGIAPAELNDNWIQGYGYALGLGDAKKKDLQRELLHYQKQIRPYLPERDGMILANTWGDRNKDGRMNEQFILKEIDRASQLGITHIQLDDGWQKGLSKNSAFAIGEKWDDWSVDDWKPHPMRFPDGFDNIVRIADQKEIDLGLWFNPSKTDDYAKWEQDADILLDLYSTYHIRLFKIDGLSFANKKSENNIRNMLTKVVRESQGRITFNMDVTAGQRAGYHFFNEFGNVFLENRYTDWGNYYPHRTFRNLWQLCAYVPADRLQIEFLNNTRNISQYPPDDSLQPSRIPIDYTSAITLPAQPLAWMELSSLPDAPKLSEQLKTYRKIADELHSMVALPIGKEPNGFSWSGYAFYKEKVLKYIFIFREQTAESTGAFTVPSLPSFPRLRRVFGDLQLDTERNKHGKVYFSGDATFSYGLFALEN